VTACEEYRHKDLPPNPDVSVEEDAITKYTKEKRIVE
jgi:hypothetical protein